MIAPFTTIKTGIKGIQGHPISSSCSLDFTPVKLEDLTKSHFPSRHHQQMLSSFCSRGHSHGFRKLGLLVETNRLCHLIHKLVPQVGLFA
jgi:hypothetical protein